MNKIRLAMGPEFQEYLGANFPRHKVFDASFLLQAHLPYHVHLSVSHNVQGCI